MLGSWQHLESGAHAPPGRRHDITGGGLWDPTPPPSHISSCSPVPLLRILSKSPLLSRSARNSAPIFPRASASLHHSVTSPPSSSLPLTFLAGVSLPGAQSRLSSPPVSVFDSLLRIRRIKVSNSRRALWTHRRLRLQIWHQILDAARPPDPQIAFQLPHGDVAPRRRPPHPPNGAFDTESTRMFPVKNLLHEFSALKPETGAK